MATIKISPINKLRLLVKTINANASEEHDEQIDTIKRTLEDITKYTDARHEYNVALQDHEPYYVLQSQNRMMSIAHNNMAREMQATNRLWRHVMGNDNGPFPAGDHTRSFDRSQMADAAGLLILEAQDKPAGKEQPSIRESHMDDVQESLSWKGIDPRLLPNSVFNREPEFDFA